jgi:hypothetical protein
MSWRRPITNADRRPTTTSSRLTCADPANSCTPACLTWPTGKSGPSCWVYYAIAVLISRAVEAADLDPDRISFVQTLRLTAPHRHGRHSPQDWTKALTTIYAKITIKINFIGTTAPSRAVERACHNSYRVKKPSEAGYQPPQAAHHQTAHHHTTNRMINLS